MTLLSIAARCEKLSLTWKGGKWSLLCVLHNGFVWTSADADLERLCGRVP